MSDDYEYEVMRAELLGLPPPEKKDVQPVTKIEDDEMAKDENIEIQDEELGSVSGGLDELSSILKVTQKRINRFKTVCGSFTNLLKLKVGAGKDDGTSSECGSVASEGDVVLPPEHVSSNSNANSSTVVADRDEMNGMEDGETIKTSSARNLELEGKLTSKDLDLECKLTRGIDKLDSILVKAEQAEISMSKQNKMMKSILK